MSGEQVLCVHTEEKWNRIESQLIVQGWKDANFSQKILFAAKEDVHALVVTDWGWAHMLNLKEPYDYCSLMASVHVGRIANACLHPHYVMFAAVNSEGNRVSIYTYNGLETMQKECSIKMSNHLSVAPSECVKVQWSVEQEDTLICSNNNKAVALRRRKNTGLVLLCPFLRWKVKHWD